MESMHKVLLHSTMIISSLVIAYFGIQSIHAEKEHKNSIATHITTQTEVEDSAAKLQRCLALNKKLLINYQNEERDLQKLGLCYESKPVQFAHKKAEKTASDIAELQEKLAQFNQ